MYFILPISIRLPSYNENYFDPYEEFCCISSDDRMLICIEL